LAGNSYLTWSRRSRGDVGGSQVGRDCTQPGCVGFSQVIQTAAAALYVVVRSGGEGVVGLYSLIHVSNMQSPAEEGGSSFVALNRLYKI